MSSKRGSPDSGPRRRELTLDEYAEGVLAGDRAILARAITLVESSAPAHAATAAELLERLLPDAGGALRVGITGSPGVGKSCLIEALGTHLVSDLGKKVAVLAVDPSSTVTGGSILGDKTRMTHLGRDERAFIRPSPSAGSLGGVARKTREAMLLCEAAGYEVVLVETVGVGQSEVTVRSMVDFFLLLMLAGAGDELQGIKKGVIELADALAITKADGDNARPAERARAEFFRALGFLTPATEGWTVEVRTCSSMTGAGIPELWQLVEQHHAHTRSTGHYERQRRHQALSWMRSLIAERLQRRFYDDARVKAMLPQLEQAVEEGSLPASLAADRLLALLD
jgi:LAO/AO transport system kinase